MEWVLVFGQWIFHRFFTHTLTLILLFLTLLLLSGLNGRIDRIWCLKTWTLAISVAVKIVDSRWIDFRGHILLLFLFLVAKFVKINWNLILFLCLFVLSILTIQIQKDIHFSQWLLDSCRIRLGCMANVALYKIGGIVIAFFCYV